jgi:hypothetical protein
MRVQYFDRGELARADAPRELHGGHETDLGIAHRFAAVREKAHMVAD